MESSRNRLRKKLELDPDTNLFDYLLRNFRDTGISAASAPEEPASEPAHEPEETPAGAEAPQE